MDKYFLYLIVFLIPMRQVQALQYLHYSFHLLNVLIGACFCYSILKYSISRRLKPTPLAVFMVVLNIFVIMGSAFNPAGLYSTLYGETFVDFFFSSMLLFVVGFQIRNFRVVSGVIIATWLAGVLQAVLGLVQYFFGVGYFDLGGTNLAEFRYINGTFRNSGALCEYMFLSICAAIALWFSRGGLLKLLAGLSIVSFYVVIVIGNARIIGVMAILVPLLVIWQSKSLHRLSGRYHAQLVGLILVIIGALWFAATSQGLESARDSYVTKFSMQTASDSSDGILGVRGAIISAGLEMFQENPLFGWGYGTFSLYSTPYVNKYTKIVGYNNQNWEAHNHFLNVLVELGLFGFIPFVAILIIGYKNFRAAQRAAMISATPAGASVTIVYRSCFLVFVSVMFFGYGVMYHLMFLLGISVALRSVLTRVSAPRTSEKDQTSLVRDGLILPSPRRANA